jgi:Uncharacterized Fe-S protein
MRWKNWIFGCDICQDVCPWNRFSKQHQEPLFEPNEVLNHWTEHDLIEMQELIFEETFKHSPLKRAGFDGIMRNIHHVLKGNY